LPKPEELLRQEPAYVLGDLFTLLWPDLIEEYGDVKAAPSLIFGPDHHTITFNNHISMRLFIIRQAQLYGDLGKRRHILIQVAISAHAAQVMSGCGEIITVYRHIKRQLML